jgi:hypothetical protein
MPRPSIGETPMTGAERQARYRTAHASGAPVIRIRRPAERRSRIQRWNDTIAAAVELQAEYAAWLDALPDNQRDSALADALRTIVEFDLSELQASNRHAASAVIEQRDGPTAWATMTRAAAYRHQPVSAGTAR